MRVIALAGHLNESGPEGAQALLFDQFPGVAYRKVFLRDPKRAATLGAQVGVGAKGLGVHREGHHLEPPEVSLGAKGLCYARAAGQDHIGVLEAVALEEAER